MQARVPGEGLEAVFRPNAIAVIGASQDSTKIGGRPVQFLRKYGFCGGVYPVNPRAPEVQGYRAYPSVADLPETPDLAVIAVSAEAAPDAVDSCAARGVKAAVVLSSGFSEMGSAGLALQDRIGATARRTGMRVIGPNCLGAVGVPERAISTFSIVLEGAMPQAGPLGIVSQSGNLGSYTMLLAGERGCGVSRFMTTGNECDVDVADGVAFMARDPATQVILLIMETCRNPDRLIVALTEARSAGKPVIVLKIGETEAGQQAAASHTGALAGSAAVFDAVFRRAGAWRVRSLEQLVDLGHSAVALGTRRMRGRRVTLLVASGGFGVLLADAASAAGLALPEPSAATQARITEIVPYASPRNPVDATAQMGARPEILAQILTALIEDEGSDAMILMASSGMALPRLRQVYTQALMAARAQFPDRIIAVCMHGPADAAAELSAMGIVVTDGVDACCDVLAGLAGLHEALAAAPALRVAPSLAAAPLPPDALRTEAGAKAALSAAGVPVLPERVVHDPAAAAAAATALGFPIVLKIVSPDLPHKTEIGGVVLGLADADAVRHAAEAMLLRVRSAAPEARIEGLLVAPMISGGTELIVGTTHDPVFGPVVMAGLGGIFAEILRDVAVRPAPVTEAEAAAMLHSLKAFAVLDGARGRPRADLTAAAAAIAAVSRFAAAHADEIAAIDVNPLLVRTEGEGAVALDALIVPAKKDNDHAG